MRNNPEKQLEHKIRKLMEDRGWMVKKTHGSGFSKDWPDLFTHHPIYGTRWIELKVPGPSGRLSDGQIREFSKWKMFNCGVWVLTSEKDYELLFKGANFGYYLMRQMNGVL